MANNLSNYIKEVWSPEVQDLAVRKAVSFAIADVEFLQAGADTFHFPYNSDLSVGSYTRNATSSAISPTDITTTDEYLQVDTCKYASFYIDRLDKVQMFYKNSTGKLLQRAAYKLKNDVDVSLLAEYANANHTIDDGDIGGTAGNAISFSTSNALDTLEAIKAKLSTNDVEDDGDWFLVCDGDNYFKVLEKYLASNGYQVQDKTIINGYKGAILGLNIFVSNNLTTASSVTHWLAGKMKSITLKYQKESQVETKDLPNNSDGTTRLGTQYIVWNLWGKKTFTEGARELVDVQIAA